MELKFENEWELKALHRVIFEAKYNDSPSDLDVQASPYSKSLADKVFSLIIELDNGKEAEKWLEWRKLENHAHRIEGLKKRLLQTDASNWTHLSDKDKVNYVNNLVSPLVASSELVSEFVAFTNSVHNGN